MSTDLVTEASNMAEDLSLASRPLESFRIARELLKDQAVAVLRDAIIGGNIPAGSKLVERDVANKLGTSRVPARDALMALEREGLLVNRSGVRYVIDVNEEDVRELYAVRMTLESLAVELACDRADRGGCEALYEAIGVMEKAIAENNPVEYRKSDFRFHKATWLLAGNQLLIRTLDAMMGSIYMVIVHNSRTTDNWQRTVELHRAVADGICSGVKVRALSAIRQHLDDVFSGVCGK
jgi:DNA-binding GntR family transcriptional regulator